MYHKIEMIGYLGRDPEMKFTANGTPYCHFSVATSRSWGSNGERQEETTWFTVFVYGNQAEPCAEYLHKGSLVFIEGRMNPDETGNPSLYKRRDGSLGASYTVTAGNVKFLDRREVREAKQVADDGLPF